MGMQRRAKNEAAIPEQPYMPGVGPGDLRPPEYRLLQGQSEAAQDSLGRPGQFYSPQMGEAIDKLEGVVINIQKTRTLWTEGELGAPRCSSNDSLVARSGSEFEGRTCAQCPLVNGPCRPGYTLTMLRDGEPAVEALSLIRLGTPTAMSAAQNYLTALWTGFGRVPFRAYTVVEAVKRTNKFGTFYVPIPRAMSFADAGKPALEGRTQAYQGVADEFVQRFQEVAGAPDGSDSSGNPPAEPGRGRRRESPPARRGPERPQEEAGAGDPKGDLW